MPVRTARKAHSRLLLRAIPRIGLAALALAIASNDTHNAVANGDTRTISFHHLHTGEDLTVTFKVNGRYDPAALKKIDWLMRDWRRNESIRMEPHLIDLIWEVYRDTGGKGAVQVVGGYRSPTTNSMLRRRSSGVAQNSLHTMGKAIDFYIAGANLDDLRAAGLRLQRGGVGFYPGSGWPFVHMDVGSVRHWPRMTHDQLAKVFPDGRTVHIPSNGQPLKNYALALADIEKRGNAPSAVSIETARAAGIEGKRTTVAGLFGFDKKDRDPQEEQDVPAAVAAKPMPKPAVAAAPPPPAPVQLAAVIPLPKGRPPVPAPPAQTAAPAAKPTFAVASLAPANVFDARGFWKGEPQLPDETSARRRAETGPASTGTVGPAPTTIGPWTRERPPGEVAIAYAAAVEPKSEPRVARAAPVGLPVPRPAAIAAGNTVALKGTPEKPSEVRHPLPATATVTGRASDEPWLRALVATPSVHHFMSTTLYGPADYRTLSPLMARPSSAIAMSFSADPHAGMSDRRFSGSAVVFVATVPLGGRTATLR